jgi:PAS domain S-box-containing protein
MIRITIILSLFVFVLCNISIAQSYSSAKVKAIWIYNIIEETTWPDEELIDTFKLGMYNPESEFYDYLKLIAANKRIKNKPLVIYNLSEYDISNLELLYLNNPVDTLLNSILILANEYKLLSIIDNTSSEHAIIKFVQRNKSLNIDINYELLSENGFKISPDLVAMVTHSEELKQLYIDAENKLAKEQDIVKQQKQEISEKEAELDKISNLLSEKIEELELKNIEIEKQKQLLLSQEKQIKQNLLQLSKLNSNISERQYELNEKIYELEIKERDIQNQKNVISIQQHNINKQLETLNKHQVEIDSQKSKIEQQQDQVYDLIEKEESQKIIIRLTIISLILTILFGIYFARNLYIKKKINRTLENRNQEILEKNEEIEQQKEELRSKAELLSATNLELEKLSLAAKKTDNAIALYDSNGDIEWVNDAFIEFHEKNVAEFIESFGANIIDHSSYNEIQDIFNKAIQTKKSVTYTNRIVNNNREEIWFQSTLTPIFEDDTLKRFIIVDSEITKIVNAQELIDQKNKDITDSIRYAERIQLAVLPSSDSINKAFENSFVYFNPRDIVSGDYYWFHKKGDRIYIAIADSTGHGVPGALMSVIGYSLLNKIVNKDRKGDPGIILDKLRKEVILALQQSYDNDFPLDGMDMSLCIFNTNNYELKFSGANQFIYIIRNKVISEYKGNSMPIALFDRMDHFSTIEIELEKDDMIYMFSDGYADQMGGKHEKKYKYRRFRNFLIELSTLPTDKQKELLTSEFNDWKGTNDQIDDVIVMGIRV